MSNFKKYVDLINESKKNKKSNKGELNSLRKIKDADKKDDKIEFEFDLISKNENEIFISSNKKIYYNNRKKAEEKIKKDFKLNNIKIIDHKTNKGAPYTYKVTFK